MLDILRDSTLGQILNWASRGKILPYRDQLPGFQFSDHQFSPPDADVEEKNRTSTGGECEPASQSFILVAWDGDDDPDNPRNWSLTKKVVVSGLIAMLNFSTYIGASIYTSAIPSLMLTFGASETTATLGLTLFVLAYGCGPMILAPLQDIPFLGRNPTYIIGLFLFVLFQLPPLVAKNMATILVFRFLASFAGSPALATGGATLGDMWSGSAMPYAVAIWAIGGVCGPTIGPVIGGFAAQANGYRWPFYELLWVSGFALIVMMLFLPETFSSTILLRRAERLRKLTGNTSLRSQSEMDQAEQDSVLKVARYNFVMAIKLCAEPAVFFGHLYMGFCYAIFYLWFSAFPLVFTDIYGFNLGLSGLPFLGFVVSAALSLAFYIVYNKWVLDRRYARDPSTFTPESRLEVAVIAGVIVPICLFIFGWTARKDVPWIAPLIGASLYIPGIFLLTQGIALFLVLGWPRYSVPIFAANALFRSSLAAFFPLFGRALFTHLGMGGGSSLLAAISILMLPFLLLLMKYGPTLRGASKWAGP